MAQAENESAEIARVLGGAPVLGKRVHTPLELEECARRGFPTGVVEALLQQAIIDRKAVNRWIIPLRTLARRQARGQRLSRDESDRVARLARIYALAVATLGSDETARHWLGRPLRQFGGRSAVEMIETDLGAHQVETLLGRVAHGIAA